MSNENIDKAVNIFLKQFNKNWKKLIIKLMNTNLTKNDLEKLMKLSMQIRKESENIVHMSSEMNQKADYSKLLLNSTNKAIKSVLNDFKKGNTKRDIVKELYLKQEKSLKEVTKDLNKNLEEIETLTIN